MPLRKKSNIKPKKKPAKSVAKAKVAPVRGPKIGAKVPDFKMLVTGGGTVSRAGLMGKPYVLYFYPKDQTSGCTVEACDFRDAMAQFNKLKIKIIGISKDSIASHDKFIAKEGLNFPLASDESGVAEKFGTWIKKSMYGRSYMGMERATFLVDAKGVVRGVWRKVSIPGHVDDVMKAAKEL